ncbi:hypothetical protein PSHT_09196, partial [Puccinia striiformis]
SAEAGREAQQSAILHFPVSTPVHTHQLQSSVSFFTSQLLQSPTHTNSITINQPQSTTIQRSLCAVSSATIEQVFSAAVQVCASGQLGPCTQTIKQCITSHMWLRSSVQLEGPSTNYQVIIDAANKNPNSSNYQTKKLRKSSAIRD